MEKKTMNNITQEIEKIIQENKQLKEENYNHKKSLDQLRTRERLYMSELQKLKNNLTIWAKSIDTTPHSHAEEYQHFYEYDHKMYVYKERLEKIKTYCEEQNLKADFTACEILQIIESEE